MQTTHQPAYKPDVYAIARGNRQAFRVFYLEMADSLYVFVKSLVREHQIAEEILQETFLKLWLKRETITEIKSLQSYCFAMARNQVLEHFRKEKLSETVLKDLPVANLTSPDPLSLMNEREYQELARQAIEALPEKRKKIFLLSREEELTYAQIGEKMGISQVAVKKQMMLALAQIREFLQQHTDLAIGLYLLLQIYFPFPM